MTKNFNDINFDIFIGPWVLPNEEIPVHITWDEDFDFDVIEIEMPENLEFLEDINVIKREIDKNKIIILKDNIKKHNAFDSFPRFFGLIFVYKEHNFPMLKSFKDLRILFYRNSSIIKEVILTAKIFRPRLKNISELTPVILEDKDRDYSVTINLACEGFGFVSTSAEAEINKIKISFDESIFKKVHKELEQRYTNFLNIRELNADIIKTDIFYSKITEDSVKKFLGILERNIYLDKSEDKSIIEIFEEENVDIIFIIDFIMEIIKELKIRYKNENVMLNNPVLELPKEKFNEFIDNIKILIHYHDLKGNKYEPVIINLDVDDQRFEPKKTRINFVIKVDKIKDNSFKDIEKVER